MNKSGFLKLLISKTENARILEKEIPLKDILHEYQLIQLVLKNPRQFPKDYLKDYKDKYGELEFHIAKKLFYLNLGSPERRLGFKKELEERLLLLKTILEASQPPLQTLSKLLNRTESKSKFEFSIGRIFLIKVFEYFSDDLTFTIEDHRKKILSVPYRSANTVVQKAIKKLANSHGVRSNQAPSAGFEETFSYDGFEDYESGLTRIQRLKLRLESLREQVQNEKESLPEKKREIRENVLIDFLYSLNSAQHGFFLNLMFHSTRTMYWNSEDRSSNIEKLEDRISKDIGISIKPVLEWFQKLQKAFETYGLHYYAYPDKQEGKSLLKNRYLPQIYINLDESFSFEYHGSLFKKDEIKKALVQNPGWLYRSDKKDEKYKPICRPQVVEIKE